MSVPPLDNENLYHSFNRGVDKRKIFMDDEDYLRFLHDMYEFNDKNCALPYMNRIKGQKIERAVAESLKKDRKERDKLVEIVCFILMPNHFHFILRQLQERGISLFMKKLCIGYANFFNLKYERSGTLFQGRYKSKLIEDDGQYMHLTRYIHVLNPGELVEPQIRQGIIRDPVKLRNFLRNYKWSSYLDYIGIKNYPSLIKKELPSGYFQTDEDYEKFAMGWKVDDMEIINNVIIEK